LVYHVAIENTPANCSPGLDGSFVGMLNSPQMNDAVNEKDHHPDCLFTALYNRDHYQKTSFEPFCTADALFSMVY